MSNHLVLNLSKLCHLLSDLRIHLLHALHVLPWNHHFLRHFLFFSHLLQLLLILVAQILKLEPVLLCNLVALWDSI